MKKITLLLSLLLFLQVSAEKLQLARAGKTNYSIVYTDREQEAAKELKLHLDKITGADFKLVKDGTRIKGPAFYVGNTSFAQSKGLDSDKLSPQEYLVRIIDGNVVIFGGRTRGTLYGVYELLEKKFKVRWFAWDTTIIPADRNLTLELTEMRHNPDFESREMWDEYDVAFWISREYFKQYQVWRKRIRSSLDYDARWAVWPVCSTQYYDVHNFYKFVSPKKYYKDHPEYFSMDAKGKRIHGTMGASQDGANFCMTNPQVREIAWNSLKDFIEKDCKKLPKEKWPTVYDITPQDHSPFLCLCPECRKITQREGSESGLLLDFINWLAVRVAKEYPGIRIRTIAYASTNKPPRFIRPEKNVIIKWCNLWGFNDCYRPITSAFNRSQKAELDGWVATGARLWIRTYWNMGGQFFNPPRVETMVDAIAPDLKYYKKCGGIAHYAEIPKDENNMQNFIFLQYYLGYRLMNDLSLNPEELITDFVKGYYGPAEKPITNFLNRLRKAVREEKIRMRGSTENTRPYCTQAFMTAVWEDLKKAQSLTQPGTLYRKHVEDEMVTPLYVILSNTQWEFPEREHMVALYKKLRLERIAENRPKNGKKMMDRLESDLLSFIKINLPIPKGFEQRQPIMLGWSKLRWTHNAGKNMLTDDPDSVTGKALITPVIRKDLSKYLPITPLNFGIYDRTIKRSVGRRIKPVPTDEKYHWYKVGKYDLGPGSFVWGYYWYTMCDLSFLWNPADGLKDFNVWEIWVSVKITGSAYVPGSKKKNEIYWDQVMLVKPLKKKAKK